MTIEERIGKKRAADHWAWLLRRIASRLSQSCDARNNSSSSSRSLAQDAQPQSRIHRFGGIARVVLKGMRAFAGSLDVGAHVRTG